MEKDNTFFDQLFAEQKDIEYFKTLADIEKRIGNMLSAIEQGIITDSTKDRLAQLEEKKKEIEITILQEKIKKPFLTKEQILFGIEKYKKLDLSTREGKQRLIDDFINAIYVYDDRITFTYNYKDGTETITLSELESAKSSDIKCVGAPLTIEVEPSKQKKSCRFRQGLFLLSPCRCRKLNK